VRKSIRSLDAVTKGGQIEPGGAGAPGSLRINGLYRQTVSGRLVIELGGPDIR
jgi:hypothetical protein